MHVFLIVALCLSQLAATAHMVAHFHDDKATASFFCGSASTQSQSALCASTEHTAHSFHGSHSIHGSDHAVETVHSASVQVDAESTIADCAIFHAYFGQVGCLTAAATGITDLFVESAVASIASQQIAIPVLFQYPIRGPPSLLKI